MHVYVNSSRCLGQSIFPGITVGKLGRNMTGSRVKHYICEDTLFVDNEMNVISNNNATSVTRTLGLLETQT